MFENLLKHLKYTPVALVLAFVAVGSPAAPGTKLLGLGAAHAMPPAQAPINCADLPWLPPACVATPAPLVPATVVVVAVWVWRVGMTVAVIYHLIEHRRLAEAPEMAWWEYVKSKTAAAWEEFLRLMALPNFVN